jgi:phytoene dehydrogenase-like protein
MNLQILQSRGHLCLLEAKIPSLSNVYLCGSGNHPGAGVSMAPGRNASQVILEDLGVDFNQLINS